MQTKDYSLTGIVSEINATNDIRVLGTRCAELIGFFLSKRFLKEKFEMRDLVYFNTNYLRVI